MPERSEMKKLILLLMAVIGCFAMPAFAQDTAASATNLSPTKWMKLVNNGDGTYSWAVVTECGGSPCGSSSSPTYTTSVLATGTQGQTKIAVTGTAIQFNATPFTLINGLTYCAATTNTAAITVGWSSAVTATVDGTGNGEVLQPGQCNSKAASSPTFLYVNGTSGNWLSYGGN